MNTKIWNKMNAIVSLVLYTALIVVILSFPQYLGHMVLLLLIVVPTYCSFYYSHLRIMEKESAE